MVKRVLKKELFFVLSVLFVSCFLLCVVDNTKDDEYDQDSSISFEDDTESTSSQENEFEDCVEYMKRSARKADEKLLKHRRNWNGGKLSGSPPKAQTDGPETPLSGIWDLSYRRDLKEKQEDQPRDGKDDLNEFVKDEETQTTQSNDLKNNNTWLTVAEKIFEWENKEKQYEKHVIDD